MAKNYAESPIKDKEGYTDSLDRVRKYLEPDHSVLEVACGTGTTAIRLAPSVGNIVATDFSTALIDIAKERQAEATPSPANLTFKVGDADNPPGDNQEYDAVIIMNTLHLLSHPSDTINVLVDKLKPGGLFMSKTHCLSGKFFLPIMLPIFQFFGLAPLLNYFTPQEVDKLHSDAGLQILETQEYEKGERRLVIARKQN